MFSIEKNIFSFDKVVYVHFTSLQTQLTMKNFCLDPIPPLRQGKNYVHDIWS